MYDSVSDKKGCFAEELLVKRMREKGYFTYKCINKGGHPCDFVFMEMQGHKLFLAECKAHEERILYPDTGLDTDDYEKYLEIRKNSSFDFILFFVDYKKQSIYGGDLSKISAKSEWNGKVYPASEKNGITYFPLRLMKQYFDLTVDEVEKLKSYTRESESNKKLKESI